MTAALSVEGIGKAFNKYPRESLRILSWLGFSTPSVIRKWVLQDISFALQPGEAVGLSCKRNVLQDPLANHRWRRTPNQDSTRSFHKSEGLTNTFQHLVQPS